QSSEIQQVSWSESRQEAKQQPYELERSCSDTTHTAWASKDHESVSARLGHIPEVPQQLTQKGENSEDSVDFININKGYSETISQIQRPSETSLNLTVNKEPSSVTTDLNIRLQSLEPGPIRIQPLSVGHKGSIDAAEFAEDTADQPPAVLRGPFEQNLVI